MQVVQYKLSDNFDEYHITDDCYKFDDASLWKKNISCQITVKTSIM